ncbi:hypothetical protein EJ07DRAFT_121769, partial [Lizonia empirigonia]
PLAPATMPTNPNSQYLSTMLNHPAAIPSHAAPAPAPPHGTTPPRPRQPSTQLHPGPAPAPPGPFTAAQRSAQARGKPFDTPAPGRTRPNSPESFARRQQRDEAAAILDSQEMLLWFSAARNESVAQTRRFYRDVVLGVPRADSVWCEEWERGPGEAGGSPMGMSLRGEKGRERDGVVPRKRYEGGGPHVVFGEGS